MKETCLLFAQYQKARNHAVFSLLQTLSPAEREQERGSYYGSLAGLARHIAGGTLFFQGIFKEALSHRDAAVKALAPLESLSIPQNTATEAQWNALVSACASLDEGLIQVVSALEEEDFAIPVPVQWYGGNPPSVPLYFLLHQLTLHGSHHRGQVSQILDELKIDNDFFGLDVTLLPPPVLPQ